MGYIDQTYHSFRCPKCGATESCKILDKGNNYSGSWWQPGPSLEKFDVQWSGGNKTEPRVERAVCKLCKVEAKHSEHY